MQPTIEARPSARRIIARVVRVAAFGWLAVTIVLASGGVIPWAR